MKKIYADVRDAVAGVLGAEQLATPEEVHARLWPHVRTAFHELVPPPEPSAPDSPAPKRDRRTRPWQYVVRFWRDEDLLGETDPAIIRGTGELVVILPALAAQLHEGGSHDLTEERVKEKLPQFRTNLGRGANATLRIPYLAADPDGSELDYMVQVDVYRLAE